MPGDDHDYAQLALAERAATAELLRGLTDAEWETPSLCEGWSVRDVAAHLAEGAQATGGRALLGLVAAGFSPTRQSRRGIARHASDPPGELAAAVAEPELRGMQAKLPFTALAEAFLHQQDIRRPLGRPRQYPAETLRAMLDATVSRTIGTNSRSRARGLRIVATDVDWTHGDGDELTGPAEALIMALNGRRDALGELGGAGLEELATRLRRRGGAGGGDGEEDGAG